MVKISEFVLNFILNSIWQIPVILTIAGVGAYLLKNGSARHRHLVWVAALVLAIAAPLLSATHLMPDSLPTFQANNTQVSSPAVTRPATQLSTGDNELRPTATQSRTRPIVNTTTNNALILTTIYGLFIGCCLIRFARLWQRKESLRRSVSFDELPGHIEHIAAHCRSLFGIRHVSVARSVVARVPCTLGTRRPLIVLPEVFAANVNEETLRSVIGHEMAHVSRRDYLTKILCEILSLPISFHPIAAVIKRRIERERELACDELVTQLVLPRQAYARSLVQAADFSLLPAQRSFMLSVFDGRMLEERVMKLTKHQLKLGSRAGKAIMVAVLFALCFSALLLPGISLELRTQAQTVLDQAAQEQNRQANVTEAPAIAQNNAAAPQAKTETRLKAPSAQERAEGACEAGRRRDGDSIPTLIAMLGDDSKTELIRCWDTGNWSPALETFKNPSPGEHAAIALASMGSMAFLPLSNQLNHPNTTVRRNAAWAIGELTNMAPGERASAGPQLSSLLSDSDEWVRMAAARALGEIRYRSAGESLIATLLDGDWRVRQLAAWALSEMKDKRAVQALCNVLTSDPRAEVRRAAAEALGEIRSAEALPSLKQALNDPEARVSAKAGWAINEIEDSDG